MLRLAAEHPGHLARMARQMAVVRQHREDAGTHHRLLSATTISQAPRTRHRVVTTDEIPGVDHRSPAQHKAAHGQSDQPRSEGKSWDLQNLREIRLTYVMLACYALC